MFSKMIDENNIPPNLLNSILTNSSLYEMFKNDFESNFEYFQGIEKEEYLREMLSFIEDALFSSNIFHIYSEPIDLDEFTEGKLSYIKNFYDDFLLEEFKSEPDNILKTKLFKGLRFAKCNDLYASSTREFNELYNYIFKESLDYFGIVEVLMKNPLSSLETADALSMKDFNTLCNYVKNNIYGSIEMSLVTNMLKKHAYKINHIFDIEVVMQLVKATIQNYLKEFDVEVEVTFIDGLESKEKSSHNIQENRIEIDSSLLDGFVMLNYVELFEHAFYEADIIKEANLLRINRCDNHTLKVLMNMIANKVDTESIFDDENYNPAEYYADLRASAFIKTLRFFESFGVNLFSNYITSKCKSLNLELCDVGIVSKKEVPLEQRFQGAFAKTQNKKSLIKKYNVLKTLYDKEGNQISTIDLVKSLTKEENRPFLIDYLHSRIIDPKIMVDDVNDLSSYRAKDEFLKSFIENELKYIYVDTFYYSLDGFIKMHKNTKFDVEEYLDELLIKVNCIKDTPLTHRFIDEALFVIDDMKQNA